MEINQLRYFLAVCEEGNFSRAAARCFTSRQNLTKSVRNLERELGCQLFVLSGRTPVLTADGEEAARYAARAVEAIDELAAAFGVKRAHEGAPRPLRLSCGLSMQHSADALYRALLGFDDFELNVSENTGGRCYSLVAQGKVDAALIYCMNRSFDECESLVLGSAPVEVLVDGASKLAAKPVVKLSDLADFLLILLPGFEFTYERFLRVYRKSGLDVDHIQSVASFESMKEWIVSHKAVSIVSRLYPEEIPQGLKRIPLEDIGCEWRAVLLYRREAERRADIEALAKHLRSSAKDGPYL